MSSTRPIVAINGYFVDQPWVGTGQYSRQLVERLPQATHRLDVRTVRQAPVSTLKKIVFEHIGFPRKSAALGAALLHVPYLGPPLWSRTPLVVTVHDLIMLALPEHAGPLGYRVYTKLAIAGAKRARLLLADSVATKNDIVRFLGYDAGRVRVIPLAKDETFRPDPDPSAVDAIRAQFGLPDRYLLYAGGFDRRKHVDTLLEALADTAIPLVITGNRPPARPPLYPDLMPAATRLGDRVRWLGRVDAAAMPLLFAGAEAFVYPSVYEGFGLPPLEAMACGTPVITTNQGSLPEVVGNAAVLAEGGSVASLREAILRVTGDPGLRRDLRERGLQQAAGFTWEATVSLTAAAYEEALDLR